MKSIMQYKINFFLYFSVIIVNLTAFTCGTAFSWTSPVLPKLSNNDENPLNGIPTEDQVSWMVSLMSLGAVFGPFAGGFFADKIGRKPTLLYTSVPFILAYVLLAFGHDIYSFCIARFIKGACLGMVLTILPMYTGEIAEVNNRGIMGCLILVFITLGSQFSLCLGPYLSVKWFSLSCTIPLVIFLSIFSILIPESPCYLLVRGRSEDAKESLAKFRLGDVEEELTQFLKMAEESTRERTSLLEVFKRKHLLKTLRLGVGLMVIQQFTAISVINFYLQVIFQEAGSELPPEVSAMIVGAVQFFGTLLSASIVDKIGRRPLLLVSTSMSSFSLLILAVYFHLQSIDMDLSAVGWIPILALVLFMVFYSLGIGPLPFAVMGELYPPNVKSAASSISVCSCYLCSFITAKVFPLLVSGVGSWFAFLIFALASGCGVIFIWVFMPETKGKSLVEIVEMFRLDEK